MLFETGNRTNFEYSPHKHTNSLVRVMQSGQRVVATISSDAVLRSTPKLWHVDKFFLGKFLAESAKFGAKNPLHTENLK